MNDDLFDAFTVLYVVFAIVVITLNTCELYRLHKHRDDQRSDDE